MNSFFKTADDITSTTICSNKYHNLTGAPGDTEYQNGNQGLCFIVNYPGSLSGHQVIESLLNGRFIQNRNKLQSTCYRPNHLRFASTHMNKISP